MSGDLKEVLKPFAAAGAAVKHVTNDDCQVKCSFTVGELRAAYKAWMTLPKPPEADQDRRNELRNIKSRPDVESNP